MNNNHNIIAFPFTPFIPEEDVSPSENVRKFVEKCRYESTVFGKSLVWDAEKWDLTGYIVKKEKTNYRVAVPWTNFENSRKGDLMRQPFLDFAKAYFRYQYAFAPTTGVSNHITALRVLEQALRESAADNSPRIENADGSVFDRAVQVLKGKYKPDTAYCYGGKLELIAKFVVEKRFVKTGFPWINPLKPSSNTSRRIGKQFDEKRKQRLPTKDTVYALAKAYFAATEPKDVIITSVGELLCAAPSRISEVLTLRFDCECTELSQGKERYGLRWWPAKGAVPMIKWVPDAMVKVTKEAIAKILKITEPWRRVARWYEEHEGRVYLSDEYAYLRRQLTVSRQEIGRILGGVSLVTVKSWLNKKKIKSLNPGAYAFSDIEHAVLSDLPLGFPFRDKGVELKYSETLFVVPRHFFNERNPVQSVMIEPVTYAAIMCGFGGNSESSSVFTRLDIVSLSGERINLKTHQIRHLLNTICQRGGLSQTDIAMWSGRTSVSQNNVYNHVSSDELNERSRQDGGGAVESGLKPILVDTQIVAKSDFDTNETPAAHATAFGFCTQSFARNPCEKIDDCINCSRHLFKKTCGNEEHLDQAICHNEQILVKAEQAGAGRWIDHQRRSIVRYKQAAAICKDPSIEEGAVFALSLDEEHSPVRIALDEYLLDSPSSASQQALPTGPEPLQLLQFPATGPEKESTENVA